jgi:hypothetical protein
MRTAGCHEVLFGVESVSPTTLRRMDKFREGLTRQRTYEIVSAAVSAGIGVHLNLIAGFPGEGPAELADSIAFVEQCGALANVTYTVNPFVVFPATATYRDPERFDLVIEPSCGDMQAIFKYKVVGPHADRWRAAMDFLPEALMQLRRSLGWCTYDELPGGREALDLYFGSGYSAIFKSSTNNPLAHGGLAAPTAAIGAVAA